MVMMMMMLVLSHRLRSRPLVTPPLRPPTRPSLRLSQTPGLTLGLEEDKDVVLTDCERESVSNGQFLSPQYEPPVGIVRAYRDP